MKNVTEQMLEEAFKHLFLVSGTVAWRKGDYLGAVLMFTIYGVMVSK